MWAKWDYEIGTRANSCWLNNSSESETSDTVVTLSVLDQAFFFVNFDYSNDGVWADFAWLAKLAGKEKIFVFNLLLLKLTSRLVEDDDVAPSSAT